jgi:hypothetical protein
MSPVILERSQTRMRILAKQLNSPPQAGCAYNGAALLPHESLASWMTAILKNYRKWSRPG